MNCPICGKECDTTLGRCSYHMIVKYDSYGRIVAYSEQVKDQIVVNGNTTHYIPGHTIMVVKST